VRVIEQRLHRLCDPVRQGGISGSAGQFSVQVHARILAAVSVPSPMNRSFLFAVLRRYGDDFAYEVCMTGVIRANARVAVLTAVASQRR